jgi:DNA ligase-1
MAKSNRREFLQQANKVKLGKTDPSGMYISEKLDGSRVLWDGGITRGIPTEQVPWANIMNPKKPLERKKKIKPISTGLWSRYGNPVIAPDWWLNNLPPMFLDGELFAGRGNFQTLRSIVAKDVADPEAWRGVTFAVFGTPSFDDVFQAGEIKNAQFHLEIKPAVIRNFIDNRKESGVMDSLWATPASMTFEQELHMLQGALTGEMCYLHQQTMLSSKRSEAEEGVSRFMDWVLGEGGEGIMLRKPQSIWTPKRVSTLLKLKPFTDDQGTLTGFTSGRQTDKGSKARGMIGALIVDYNGKRLELAGLNYNDGERKFATEEQTKYAYENPGVDMPSGFQGTHFKVGDTIEFRYRELSDDGIPKEARFLRGV